MADYPDFEKSCGYGDVTGILGANCRHSFWAYVEGVSERTYTDEELEAMKPENRPKIQFEGREYDDYQATQKQRQIERTIRKIKRRKAASEAHRSCHCGDACQGFAASPPKEPHPDPVSPPFSGSGSSRIR